jgi:hypothetical protein
MITNELGLFHITALTPQGTDFLEKLLVTQLVKKSIAS